MRYGQKNRPKPSGFPFTLMEWFVRSLLSGLEWVVRGTVYAIFPDHR